MIWWYALAGGALIGIGYELAKRRARGIGRVIVVAGCALLLVAGVGMATPAKGKPWPAVKAGVQASQDRVRAAWPRITAALPGLSNHADAWTFDASGFGPCFYVGTGGEMADDGDGVVINVAQKGLPHAYRMAAGNSCYVCLHADGTAVDLSKSVCKSLFLERSDIATGDDDNLVVPLP